MGHVKRGQVCSLVLIASREALISLRLWHTELGSHTHLKEQFCHDSPAAVVLSHFTTHFLLPCYGAGTTAVSFCMNGASNNSKKQLGSNEKTNRVLPRLEDLSVYHRVCANVAVVFKVVNWLQRKNELRNLQAF